MQYPHLFRVGPSTYAVFGVGEQKAYAYMREVMRIKPGQYKYLGPDKRTPKQQYESNSTKSKSCQVEFVTIQKSQTTLRLPSKWVEASGRFWKSCSSAHLVLLWERLATQRWR